MSPVRREVLLVGVLLLAAIVASVWIALDGYRGYRAEVVADYRVQSELMAATYARVVGAWWVRDNVEMIDEGARLMVVGSARFVCVVVRGETLVSRRDDDFGDGPPCETVEAPAADGGDRTRGEFLDVTVPIPVTGLRDPVGMVRVGFDRAHVIGQLRSRAWATAGIATAANAALLVVGLLWILLRRRRTTALGAQTDERSQNAARIVRGPLEIDPTSKTARWAGRDLGLTPKPFALLQLLAEVPDRVLADDDLLAAIWPDSPYANSRDVKQLVYSLRKRLRDVVAEPADVVVNVKGFGYKLVVPDGHDPNLKAV